MLISKSIERAMHAFSAFQHDKVILVHIHNHITSQLIKISGLHNVYILYHTCVHVDAAFVYVFTHVSQMHRQLKKQKLIQRKEFLNKDKKNISQQ